MSIYDDDSGAMSAHDRSEHVTVNEKRQLQLDESLLIELNEFRDEMEPWERRLFSSMHARVHGHSTLLPEHKRTQLTKILDRYRVR